MLRPTECCWRLVFEQPLVMIGVTRHG